MCALAGISRAGYYRAWQASAPRQEATELRHQIQLLRLAHRHYGYRRISVQLQRDGWAVNRKRVLRLMREDNLLCLPRRRFVPATTDSRHHWPFFANLAATLRPGAVNQLWVADITYVHLREAFIYLAVLLDAFSRKVIGWSLAEHLQASLAIAALEMALASRVVIPGVLVHHSDRGIQYACGDYVERLRRAGIVPSMSRAGRPWDNAVAESFMRTLKREEVDGREYRDLAAAQASIGSFLEATYNRQRLHSALGYWSPEQFEQGAPALLPAAPPAIVADAVSSYT